MVSGESDKECIERAIESGVNKFMGKPAIFKDIENAIKPYLNNQ
jgi:response regulator of citrate/malate metabolism